MIYHHDEQFDIINSAEREIRFLHEQYLGNNTNSTIDAANSVISM